MKDNINQTPPYFYKNTKKRKIHTNRTLSIFINCPAVTAFSFTFYFGNIHKTGVPTEVLLTTEIVQYNYN